MRKSKKTYTVRYELDEAGWWVASVVGVSGCHTQGRTIEQARERAREALALFDEQAAAATLVDDVKLPLKAKRVLAGLAKAKARAEAEEQRLRDAQHEAALVLTKDVGLSLRDAGELLGLTRERVRQVASKFVHGRSREERRGHE